MPDRDIVAKAIKEKRITLTHDLDFGRIVALSRAGLPSVTTFRLVDMRSDNVNRHLIDLLERFSDELSAGALASVSDETIRICRLPID